MGLPHFEQLGGIVDGVNTVFTTSVPYTAGTVAVLVRGLARIRTNDDGWVETDPATGVITLKEPPEGGGTAPDDETDTVQAFYLDQTTGPLIVTVTPLSGVIGVVDVLAGTLETIAALSGLTGVLIALQGELVTPTELDGVIDEVQQLTGTLEVCT
jgi:hypothetical protein